MAEKIKIKSIKERAVFAKKPKEAGSILETNSYPLNKKSSRLLFMVFVILFSFIVGILGGVLGPQLIMPYLSTLSWLSKYEFLKSQEASLTIKKEEVISVKEESAIIDTVKKISPAVVSIIATASPNELLGRIYQVSAGTGFIITTDGLIITNKHVVANSQEKYTVIIQEGKSYQVKNIIPDPLSDLAFVKIDADNLPVVELGFSDQLQVGQQVVAIGNALGRYQNSVTSGVISALNRTVDVSGPLGSQTEKLEGVIQTDAAINFGNSGGPLVDLSGKVIGINTAIEQEGKLIGFAIPINNVKPAISSVIENGRVIRPLIGVYYLNITPELASINNLPTQNGALIYNQQKPTTSGIVPGSPAEKADLQRLDIIIEINGQKIDQIHSLAYILQQYQPDDEIELTILRNNKEKKVKLVLAEIK